MGLKFNEIGWLFSQALCHYYPSASCRQNSDMVRVGHTIRVWFRIRAMVKIINGIGIDQSK